MSKSLGGGGVWPLSATIIRADISDSLPKATHTSTFCGNPLGCGLGLKTLDFIEENKLCERSAEYGKYLMNRLLKLKDEFDIIGYVEGRGLAIGIEFVKDRLTKEPATEETKMIMENSLSEGLLLQRSGIHKNRINLSPSLLISKEEINEFILLVITGAILAK